MILVNTPATNLVSFRLYNFITVCTGGRPNHPPPPRPLGRNGNVVHNENVKQVQDQVNDVAFIAKQNIEKVLNRENKLNDLDSRAQELHSGAKVFVNQAGKLKRKVRA